MNLQYTLVENGSVVSIEMVPGIVLDHQKIAAASGQPGLAPMWVGIRNGRECLEFGVEGFRSLAECMNGQLTVYEFLSLELALAEAGRSAQAAGIAGQLAEFSELIFISGKQARLLVIPVSGYSGKGIQSILLNTLYDCVFVPGEPLGYVQEVMACLRGSDFTLEGTIRFLKDEIEKLQTISRMNAMGGTVLFSDTERYHQQMKEEEERKAAEEVARQLAERQAAEEARRLAEQQAAEEEARRLAEQQAAEEAARRLAEQQAAKEAARRLAEQQAAEEAARRLAEQQAAEEAARRLAEQQAAEEAKKTNQMLMLVLNRTGAKMLLNAPVTRIGKKESIVDFCIADNRTVSRHHADILKEEDDYYLVDCGSLNKSYVNGQEAPEGVKVPIHQGDQITLSDEQLTLEKMM